MQSRPTSLRRCGKYTHPLVCTRLADPCAPAWKVAGTSAFLLTLGLMTLGLAASPSFATTATSLEERIVIDGDSSDFEEGEAVFGITSDGQSEEPSNDSVWGPNNDINQIKITWDAQNLYIACDGYIWDNNMILLMDLTGTAGPEFASDGEGLTAMTELNSWRRNFAFSQDFTPDLFLATWDGNSAPQIWTFIPDQENQVQQALAGTFQGVATFLQNSPGRCMEAAIPWNLLFGGRSEEVQDPDSGVDTWAIPADMRYLRFAAVVTAGPDGTGGPDSAPDNLTGHQQDSAVLVPIDNFAVLPIDENEDGIADFGIEPHDRIDYKLRPPFQGIRFEVASVTLDRKIVSPEEGRSLAFRPRLTPELDPDDHVRTIVLTARIYDSLGRIVRTLYTDDRRFAADPTNPDLDQWDGFDERGRMVEGGIYVLSVVSGESPGQSRSSTVFGVVR